MALANKIFGFVFRLSMAFGIIFAALACMLKLVIWVFFPSIEPIQGKIQNVEKIQLNKPGNFTVWYFEGTCLKGQQIENAKQVNIKEDVSSDEPQWVFFKGMKPSYAKGVPTYSYVEIHIRDKSKLFWMEPVLEKQP